MKNNTKWIWLDTDRATDEWCEAITTWASANKNAPYASCVAILISARPVTVLAENATKFVEWAATFGGDFLAVRNEAEKL